MTTLLQRLNQRPIAYYPLYRQLTGSTTGGVLLSQLMYWLSKKDKIHKTDEEIKSETLLTKKELENAKKLIKKLEFIIVTREGIPAKTFYEIDWDKWVTCLTQSGCKDSTKGGNCDTPKGETNNDISKETTTETTTETKKTIKKIIDYLNLVADTNFKPATKKTQILIEARFKEGFDLDDFLSVINKKTNQWKEDKKMCVYLRPETLFGSKFEGYLNEKIIHGKLEVGAINYDERSTF